MKIKQTEISGLAILEPDVIEDARGYFFESLRQSVLDQLGFTEPFVQENESMSNKGSLRGLHLQAPPHAQAKLIRVVRGAILDVALDVRKDSETYGKYYTIELTGRNKRSFLVPEGFAHGFYCLEDHTIVQYKCSSYYHKESEMGVAWNDPSLAIPWPEGDKILSEKDRHLPLLSDFVSPF